jgi:hypothetical protein
MTGPRFGLLGAIALSVACSGPGVVVGVGSSTGPTDPTGPTGPTGRVCAASDLSASPEIEVVYQTSAGEMTVAAPMQDVPLLQPPQGGKALFIGVRAKNIEGCNVTISAGLIDTGTQAVVAFERRPILLAPDGQGWFSPAQPQQITNYSNLPACPRAHLDRAIEGEPYDLVVSIEDEKQRRAEKRLVVVPRCSQPEMAALCHCECAQHYVLGASCASADGGQQGAPAP